MNTPGPHNDDHREKVCRIGQGAATCSYLMCGAEGWLCAKETEMQSYIDARRAAGQMGSMGDNCSGPPFFEATP